MFTYDSNIPLNSTSIPGGTKHLIFGDSFNQPLKRYDIPESVTTLTFGWMFNQPLKRYDIPESVTTLTFGYSFTQPLKRYDIPESVTTLTFGTNFNQPLNPDIINYKNIIMLNVHNPAYLHDRYQVPIVGAGDQYWKYENSTYSPINTNNLASELNKIIYDTTFKRAHQQGHELISRLPHDMINLIRQFI
jgi:hypothetical protein